MAWKPLGAILVVNYPTKTSWHLEEATAVRKQIPLTVKRNSKRSMPHLGIRPLTKESKTLLSMLNRPWSIGMTWGISIWTMSAKNKTWIRLNHVEFTNQPPAVPIILHLARKFRVNIIQKCLKLHVAQEFHSSLPTLLESLTSLNAQTTFTHNKHIWTKMCSSLNHLTKMAKVIST